jgi:Cu+-exporting ATPase
VTRAASEPCALCGLPVLGRPVRSAAAKDRGFCCEGCARVWAVASENGIVSLTGGPVLSRASEAAARRAAAAAAVGARRVTMRAGGMWCASCALVLSEALLDVPGVLDAEVSYAASLARVTYDPTVTDASTLTDRAALLGYTLAPGGLAADGLAPGRATADLFLRFFVSAVVGMWVMWPTLFLLYPAFLRAGYAGQRDTELFTGALALVVLLYGGWPFLVGAWRAARVGRATMDTLVVLGTWTAWGYSAFAALTSSDATYFESAAMITTIVLLGRWIESFGRADAASALAAASAGPSEVRLVPGGGGAVDAVRIPARDAPPGSTLAVRGGDVFPCDGVVVSGHTAVDQARLTGEPLPVERGPGDEVWAGTVNVGETVLVRLDRMGPDTLAGRIVALVEDAAFAKSRAERLADLVAGVFVPVVLAVAAATLLLTLVGGAGYGEAVRRAVTVLVVACPCALGLATPLAVANASARASRAGVLVRGGDALERAGEIATVAFDKTGTLTQGRPVVAAVLTTAAGDAEGARLLRAAASVEADAAHPAAAAISAASPGAGVAAGVLSRPGLGVEGVVDGARVLVGSERLMALEGIAPPPDLASRARAEQADGASVVWVAEGGRVLGCIVLADPVRPETASVVDALRQAGMACAVVSGDAEATCRVVAKRAGIETVRGGVLPHDKERIVRELAAGGPVAFVGDGINDGPALAAADLAVGMGEGAEVALLASDLVLVGGSGAAGLTALPMALRLARRTRRVVRQNLGWAFAYNAVGVPLAVAGLLSPIAAAAAMALSSLAVVANSLRLRLR